MFDTRKRDNGETFVCFTDDAPEWLRDVVRDLHSNSFPSDWIYCAAKAAVEQIESEGYDSDNAHEWADGMVDIYTRDLYQFAADNCLTGWYGDAESEADDLGHENQEPHERIALVQYCAYARIFNAIGEAIEENNEQGDEL